MNSVDAIKYQVTNGKNAMPAFGGRLAENEIEDVANFVLSKSEKVGSRNFLSFILVSVTAPTLITAIPPESWQFDLLIFRFHMQYHLLYANRQ